MQESQNSLYHELQFYWEDTLWLEYLSQKNIENRIAALLHGMDSISVEYVQMHIHLLKLLPYKKYILLNKHFGWTRKDARYMELAQQAAASEQKKVKEVFIHVNKYGMGDLPSEVFDFINGKCIVDGGAYTGDTLQLFHTLFPQSRIFAFEPQKSAFAQLQKNIARHAMTARAVPVHRGLSHTDETLTLYTDEDLDAGATCNSLAKYHKVPTDTIKATSIDAVFSAMKMPVGLIKLDIEGLEMKAIEGARQTIQSHKPVIVAAIYHRPEDFFELKQYIQEIHPEYKFMIRRSEMAIPMADLVLIAY